jgi:hypothetical protein
MSQDEDAARSAVLALHNALSMSADAEGDVDVIVDNHDIWIKESSEALCELDLYLSGERRRFGVYDTEDLRALFLGGDDFVAVMNGGSQLHLTANPSEHGGMIKFRARDLWCLSAWGSLFRDRQK